MKDHKKSRDKIKWEDAILSVVKECGGSATLKELYQKIPQIREVPPHLDVNHNIRAYLRRMTRITGKLKRIGLGIYAFARSSPFFPVKTKRHKHLLN